MGEYKLLKMGEHIWLWSRGRLVQWKTVRLPIQRSGFASRLRQMILLSRVFKSTHIYRTAIYRNSSAAKSESAISGTKQSLHLSLYEKERTYKLVLWRHLECGMTSYLIYYAILQLQYCNLLQYYFASLTYGGVRTLIGNRPRPWKARGQEGGQ